MKPTKCQIDLKSGYVHVHGFSTHRMTIRSALAALDNIAKICKENQYAKLLMEGQRPNILRTPVEVYNFAEELQRLTMSGFRIALLFHDHRRDELSDFLETAAYNRGIAIAFFTKSRDAFEWLDVEKDRLQSWIESPILA